MLRSPVDFRELLQAKCTTEPVPPIFNVHKVLQIVGEAVTELAILQPCDPYWWMGDYILSHASTKSHLQENIIQLRQNYETKARHIQGLIKTFKFDRKQMKLAIREALALEEQVVDDDNHLITREEKQTLKYNRNADTIKIHWKNENPLPASDHIIQANLHLRKKAAFGNINSVLEMIIPDVIDGLLELWKIPCKDPIEWIGNYLKTKSPLSIVERNEIETMNYYIQQLDENWKEMEKKTKLQLKRKIECQEKRDDLLQQMKLRNQLIDHLVYSHRKEDLDPSIHAKSTLVNGKLQWICHKNLLDLTALTKEKEIALRRAERIVMKRDEDQLKAVIKFIKEFKAARKIQALYRCHAQYLCYHNLLKKRESSAIVIQDKFRNYMYKLAISVPEWCIVGSEVTIDKRIARNLAATFKFFKGKDYPVANSRQIPSIDLAELKRICRNDETSAGFSTDGWMKRFLPKKFSELLIMEDISDYDMQAGLYYKVLPEKGDEFPRTGIIVEIPKDIYATALICIDGTTIEENIAFKYLRARWDKKYDWEKDCFIYVDLVTKQEAKQQPSYLDELTRTVTMYNRKTAYEKQMKEKYEKEVITSAIKLQSLWRKREARRKFKIMLEIKARELERLKQVAVVSKKVEKKKAGFFSKNKKK